MAEPGPRRLRRLPRLPGRRPARAAGRVRARARRTAALVVAPDLEAERLVRRPQPPRRPLVLEQRGDDQLRGVVRRCSVDGVAIGTLEGAYAERLVPGDRFVLDGRSLEFRRREGSVHPRPAPGGRARRCRSGTAIASRSRSELAAEVAEFRAEGRTAAAPGTGRWPARLADRGAWTSRPSAARRAGRADRGPGTASARCPRPDELLVEEYPSSRAGGAGATPSTPRSIGRPARRSGGRRRPGWAAASAATWPSRSADLGWSIRLARGGRARDADLDELLSARGARGRRARRAGSGRASRPAVPLHRGHGADGPAQSGARAGECGSGG